MTPQSSFMVVAPIEPGQVGALRELVQSMNSGRGQANPNNPIVPFGRFESLQFARFVILDDQTTGDCAVYNLPQPVYLLSIAFLGDFDGDYDDFLRDLDRLAGVGLPAGFLHFLDFESQ